MRQFLFIYSRFNHIRYFFINIVCAVSLVLIMVQNSYGQILSPEEQAWVSEHPIVKIANQMGKGPFDFVSAGKPTGFSIDYLNLLASKVGLKINYINGYSWSELLDLTRRREIDVIHSLSQDEDREGFLNFSKAYLKLPIVYYGRTGSPPIKQYEDLQDKTIATVLGWSTNDIYKNIYPDLKVTYFPTVKDALFAVSAGKVDVFSGTLNSSNFIISRNFISGLEVLGEEILPEIVQTDQLHLAARNDWPLLISILNKAMDAVSDEEFMAISEKWPMKYQPAPDIGLSEEEQQWLAANNTIRVAAEPNTFPYEFVNEKGEVSGISGSYLEKISKLLNVNFIWSKNKNWDEGFIKIKAGEAEILSSIVHTKEREDFLLFTEPYNALNFVIFARDGDNKFLDMDSLSGHKLAQMKGSAVANFIKQDYPKIEIVEASSVLDVIKLLSSGKVDAFVGDIPSTASYISSTGLTNISVVAVTDYSLEASMAIRKDLPLLASAMQKALETITAEERAKIKSQWFTVKFTNNQNHDLIIKILIIAIMIIAIIFIWANSLRVEMNRRKIVEEKLRLSQKEAEEANEAKSTFLANMSHEIRTPLNAIIGFSELMSSGLLGKIEQPKYIEYLHDIENSGYHLETVINDILDLSKIEAGKWQLTESEFNLDQCIENAFKMIIRQAEDKNIKLIKNITTTKQAIEIIGDVTAYKRIIINLLSNSVKFTQQDGKISCEVSINTDGSIKLEIIDNGIGIPADEIEHVLKPFAQAHDSRNMNDMGTGLGLPIVAQLCELHGGSFSLQSEVNVGTIATVLIPSFRVNVDQRSLS